MIMKRILTMILAVMPFVCTLAADQWEYPTSSPKGLKGTGVENDPFQINSAQDLADFAYLVNNNELDPSFTPIRYVVLNCDIVLNDNLCPNGVPNTTGAKAWTPIGYWGSPQSTYFTGFFDGQGHTISGLYINDPDGKVEYLGLFGCILESVKNLKVIDSVIKGGCNCTGGIVGYAKYAAVTNCTFQGYISNGTSEYLGGVVGCHWGLERTGSVISDCHFEGTIHEAIGSTGATYIGGITGYASSNVSGCTVRGSVRDCDSSNGNCQYIGGIVGWSEGSVTDCINKLDDGIVSSMSAKYVGGVAGCVDVEVKHCFNYANVQGAAATCYVGGVAGYAKNASFCGNLGYMELYKAPKEQSYSDFCGAGVVGWSKGIDCSFNAGKLKAENAENSHVYLAGVCAYTEGYMKNCVNTGEINTTCGVSPTDYKYALAQYSYYDLLAYSNFYLEGSAKYSSPNTNTYGMMNKEYFQSYTNDGIIAYMEDFWGSGTWGLDPVSKLPIPIECGGVDAFFVMNGKGAGTAEAPYLITDYNELSVLHDRLSKGVNYKGIHFKQTCDLDFAENTFQPLGMDSDGHWKAFLGHYDGDNHTVKNISYSTLSWFPTGFFAELGEGAEVKNLKFTDNSLTVSAAGKVGMVAGKATKATLSGIYVRDCNINQTLGPVMETVGSQIGYDHGAGALVGVFTGSISRSSVYYTDITGNQVGGLAGIMQGSSTVEDAVVQASLHASQYNVGENSYYPQCAGGITSRASSVKVARCVVLPTVDYATYDTWGRIGGLFGVSNSGNSAEYTMCDMRQPASSGSTWGLLMGSNGGAASLATTAVQIYDKARYKGYGDALTNTDGIKDVVADLHGWSPIYLNGGASNLGNMHFSYRYAVPQQGIGSYAVTSASGEYSDTPGMADYSEGFWTRPEHLYIDLSHPETAWDNNVLTAVGDIDPLIVERKGNVVSRDGKASTIYLYDAKPVTYPASITTDKLNYSRHFANTSWQPLYVPFSMACDKWTSAGLEVASISALSETHDESGNPVMVLEVKRVTEGTIEANTPYLVRAKETGEKTIDLRNVTLAATETTAKVLGTDLLTCTITPTYAEINTFNSDGDDATTDYLMKGGAFGKASVTAVLHPQRWFITLRNNKSNIANMANRIIILESGAGSATRIEDIRIEAGSTADNQPVYDLQGRRLSFAPQKGIYIINNKKTIK